MDNNLANLTNLTTLWQQYQAEDVATNSGLRLHRNISWPHKLWADLSAKLSTDTLSILASEVPTGTLMPMWPCHNSSDLLAHNSDWEIACVHAVMMLELADQPPAEPPNTGLDIRPVDRCEVEPWCAAGSEAFGYNIDPAVIQPLIENEACQLLIGYADVDDVSRAVATGMLFRTGNYAGIHQIGVIDACRGRGYANSMMLHLIKLAQGQRLERVFLQASEAGKQVYEKIGFTTQFNLPYITRCQTEGNNLSQP